MNYRSTAMTTGDFSIRLKFFDDDDKPPVLFKVNGDITANQFYSRVAAEADVSDINRFQLYYNDDDDEIKRCDMPLNQIFQANEVDVLLVLTMDSAGGSSLVSSCANCPSDDGHGGVCGTCNGLTDDRIIYDIVSIKENAWSVFCEVFNISANVQQKIEDNSADGNIRCIDVMHHVYHSNTNLTWDDIRIKTAKFDPDLAKVISKNVT